MTLYFQIQLLKVKSTEDTRKRKRKRNYHHWKRNVIKVLKRKRNEQKRDIIGIHSQKDSI